MGAKARPNAYPVRTMTSREETTRTSSTASQEHVPRLIRPASASEASRHRTSLSTSWQVSGASRGPSFQPVIDKCDWNHSDGDFLGKCASCMCSAPAVTSKIGGLQITRVKIQGPCFLRKAALLLCLASTQYHW